MFKKVAILGLLLTYSTILFAADYCFPSANPPAGKKASDVKQYVVFAWDDNSYSGKRGTQYEDEPGGNYQNSSWVGGVVIEGGSPRPKPNVDNLTEGMIGVSWAAQTLSGHIVPTIQFWNDTVAYGIGDSVIYHDSVWIALIWTTKGAAPQIYPDSAKTWDKFWKFKKISPTGLTRTNPDGSPIHFTFNVISGLFVPTWPSDWQARESEYGFWVPNQDLDYPDGTPMNAKHTKIAIAWGREMQILTTKRGPDLQQNFIKEAFEAAIKSGHEIGNHTIDHMESNSPLPNNEKGFGRWDGEGFDTDPNDVMPWGETIDEGKYFGQKPGASAQTMGWKMFAGRYISKKAWKGAVEIGEVELEKNLGISVSKGNCYSFRAPRLEVSSGLYYALKELGYQYDCGLEEGYEHNVNGTNQLWPYTLDNNSPNVTYQRMVGEYITMDSMPSGLWEMPSNVIVVPKEIQKAVYDNHFKIVSAAPDGGDIETFDSWVESGAKITAYDFNIWILWGITEKNWLTTMKYNVEQRLANNKAPLHYGVHTDYYTPIYDNATLMSKFNKASYGLNITEGWNTWEDRISATEEFVDWALTKDCYFISGHELIEEIKKMQKDEKFGAEGEIDALTWNFIKNDKLNSTASKETCPGNIDAVKLSVDAAKGDEFPYAGFGAYESAGFFEGMTHIALTYKTTAALTLRLTLKNDQPWEVTLGNIGPETKSGRIPLSAFHYNQYDEVGANKSMNTSDIVGIEVQLLTPAAKKEDHTLTIKDLLVYGAKEASVYIKNSPVNQFKQNIAIQAFTHNTLSLNVKNDGKYSISIMTANGKIVKSFINSKFKAGMNNLSFENFSSGVYLINIHNKSFNVTIKSFVM